jgi:hypothetical protein
MREAVRLLAAFEDEVAGGFECYPLDRSISNSRCSPWFFRGTAAVPW